MKITLISVLLMLVAFQASALSRNSIRQAMNGAMKLESDAPNSDTWKDILDSFLEGAQVDTLVSNSTECVHDLEYSYADTAESITHFISKGWTWENYLDLNEAFGTFTPLVRTCYDVTVDTVADVEEHFTKFESFVEFATQAKDNVVAHIFDWYDVVSKLNEAFSKQNNKDTAYQVGRALNLFLNFDAKLSTSTTQKREATSVGDFDDILRDAEEFLKGFLNGTQVLSSERVTNCVNETEFMVASVEDAYTQYEKHTDDSFREAVFEIADTFEHLKPLNEECYYAVIDIESTIQKYIKTFSTPLDILFNAARHFNELYSDIIALIQHVKNNEWYTAGENFGDIFFNVFFDQ